MHLAATSESSTEGLLHHTPDAVYVQRDVFADGKLKSSPRSLNWTFGTFQGGPTLLPLVWERATHVFDIEPDRERLLAKFPSRPTVRNWSDTPSRTPKDLLNRFPVDVLVIDHSRDHDVGKAVDASPLWYSWLEACDDLNLPTLLIQVWPQWATSSDRGPLSALQRKFLSRTGYESRYDLLNTVKYGSPVQQTRLVIMSYKSDRINHENSELSSWALQPPDNLPPRPMSNCLRPFGAGNTVTVPPVDVSSVPSSITDPMPSCAGSWIKTPMGFRRLFADELAKGLGVPNRWAPPGRRLIDSSLNWLPGTHVWEAIGNSLVGCLRSLLLSTDPCSVAATTSPLTDMVQEPCSFQSTTLETDPPSTSRVSEATTPGPSTTAAGQVPFVPFTTLETDQLSIAPISVATNAGSAECTTLETEPSSIPLVSVKPPAPLPPLSSQHRIDPVQSMDHSPEGSHLVPETADNHWEWRVPDIRPNRTWHKRRIQTLKKVVRTYPLEHQHAMIMQGKDDLRRHRANYGDKGATYLQILWWEFPAEHWEPLRTGCSMNFIEPPSVTIMPNGRFTPEQTSIANEFFEELIDLGVLELAPDDDPILGNAPLFCIPKAGQPGQWRVLANMKEGRQNDTIGNEPVYLPRVSTILPHMYSNGWSATVDASKFFYQFPTVISERKYLGCIHPVTGRQYRYRGLPMGAGNSPAIAGRMGATILRQLAERHPELFGGVPVDNTWQQGLKSRERLRHTNTRYGRGRILICLTGDTLPAILTWVHVDDFLFHGPTFAKTASALSAFMDLALELGLLCNPTKTVPPTQVVKYCGFLYDTTKEPKLVIPPEKRSRARVQVQYTLQHSTGEFSRLALSVVNGVLQSLVDATPTRIGQTYLRALHDLISTDNDVIDPKARFYTMCRFTVGARESLEWWDAFLALADSRPIRPLQTASIGCAWGDGSGTGTGGTTEVLGDADSSMRMWMGTWAPHVHQFSSNWRELKTLWLTLEQEVVAFRDTGTSRFSNMTLLYFTDNMTAYHITTSGSSKSSSLQVLVKQIKHFELLLNCHLEVVHVPGTTMITQGTDGISRGVWLSPLHDHRRSENLMSDLFGPVIFSPALFTWVLKANPLYREQLLQLGLWTHIRWDQDWVGRQLFDCFTIWTPPPEMASQTISFVLQTWIERPSTTSALFFVPRILQRDWRRLSRHIVELEPITPTGEIHDRPTVHLLPVTVLYLPQFVSRLLPPSHRMVESAVPANARWHRQQADTVRGLLTTTETP